MKKLTLALLATLVAATQTLAAAAPADLARDVAAAAAKKADVSAPIAKAFDTALAKPADSKSVKEDLFQLASGVGAVLPTLDKGQREAAVKAVMKAAESCAKAIEKLDKLEGDAVADNLGKCYAIAAAALANVLPPETIRKDVADFIRTLVPEAFADQVAAAMGKPAEALGAVKAREGQDIASAVNGKDDSKPEFSNEYLESISITTSTTTTTTTTTTSTTQVVISLDGKLVDPVTLQPIVPPAVPVTPVTPPRRIVPPTRRSPTPVGNR